MTLTVTQTLVTIAAIALGVQISRWLPFAAFSGKKELPEFIKYLGRVYCFKSTPILTGNHGLPELIATAVVIGTYAWKENFLISVGGGTAVYMLLVQFVF